MTKKNIEYAAFSDLAGKLSEQFRTPKSKLS